MLVCLPMPPMRARRFDKFCEQQLARKGALNFFFHSEYRIGSLVCLKTALVVQFRAQISGLTCFSSVLLLYMLICELKYPGIP